MATNRQDMKRIFRNPWTYVIIYLLLGFFTNVFNRMDNKIDSLVLQPIPDNIVRDNPLWLVWYTSFFVLVVPTFLVYLISKTIINKVR